MECQYIKQESANWGHFFYVSFWRRDRHCTWSSQPREGLAACCAKEVRCSFLSYFKTLSNGPAPGIELATSRSAVKRSTDWANPSAVKPTRTPQGNFSFHIFSEKKLSHKRILTQTQAYELHMQKMSRVANFVNKPSGTSRYMKKTSARVLFPPHPCPESMLQAMELRKRKCCHRVQRRCVCRYNIKTRRNLWKNGLFWSRYGFVTHSIDCKLSASVALRATVFGHPSIGRRAVRQREYGLRLLIFKSRSGSDKKQRNRLQ